MGERITVDSHSLIWYLHKPSNIRLTAKALEAMDNAENNGIIYVPSIALLEVMRLIEKGRYPIDFDAIVKGIEEHSRYEIVPLTTEVIKISRNMQGLELHDRAIVATAIITNSVLVSKDRQIGNTYNNVIWADAR